MSSTKNNELQTIASEQYRQLKQQLGTEIQLYCACASFHGIKITKKKRRLRLSPTFVIVFGYLCVLFCCLRLFFFFLIDDSKSMDCGFGGNATNIEGLAEKVRESSISQFKMKNAAEQRVH